MTVRPGGISHGVALRIYVVTVTAVLATTAALFLVLTLARQRREPSFHEMFEDLARYAAARVSERWSSPKDLRREVLALREGLHVRAAVYLWDGSVVAAPGDFVPAPLSSREREDLARVGFVKRSSEGPAHRLPELALPVTSGSVLAGYVILVPPPLPHPGPDLPPELLTLSLVLVGVGVAAVVLGGTLARPLDRLARTARAFGSGDLSARTGIERRDEVGAVARAFDDMAIRLTGLLRGQTELIANVAHELRSPLARIRVALDLAREGDATVARESLSEIGQDLAELEGLVSDVLTSARMDLATNAASGRNPPMHFSALDLGEVLEEATERLRHRHPERAVECEIESQLPRIPGDRVLFRRALDNLLENAHKYSSSQKAIRLLALRRGGALVVEVIDRGEGMTRADLDRLFTPFFRADRSRARATGGVGLGLALSRRIVEAHGGTLVAESAPGEGTKMTITLTQDSPSRP